MARKEIALVAATFLLLTSGCRVQVEKGKDGNDNKVKIDTPVGRVHVNADDVSAVDVGLPVYPGAQPATDGNDKKSADIQLGFGDWQFRMKVASFESSDSPEKITAFYQKALGRYGDVIHCQGNQPVGEPTHTREGLTCGSYNAQKHVHVEDLSTSLEAGSKHRQHIFGIDRQNGAGTRFALIELQLPSSIDEDSSASN